MSPLVRLAALVTAAGVVLACQPLLLSAELAIIDGYQYAGSSTIGRLASCRFEPTCSHYAEQALREDGLWKGNWRIAVRLLHCSAAGRLYDWAVGE